MRIANRIAAALLLAATPFMTHGADKATLLTAKELKWIDVAEPAGAQQAALWGASGAPENAVLARWKFGSKLPARVHPQDLHIVVMAGTFTVELDGVYREFGPGGFVNIPKGTTHVLGCEAAGECRFLLHSSK